MLIYFFFSEAVKLEKILQDKGETSISFLKAKILVSKEVVKYKNKNGDAVMKEIILAHDTAHTKAIAYDERKFPSLVEGEAVILTNGIKKSDGFVFLTLFKFP